MDLLFKLCVKVAYFSLPGLYPSFAAMHIMHTMLDIFCIKCLLQVCVRVCLYMCHCPGPISKVGWGASTRCQSAQAHLSSADSVVKYFSVVLQPQAVKLRRKSKPQTSSLERKYICFFRCVCHQCSCRFFQSCSFVVSFFLSFTSVFWWWQTPV